MTGNCCYCATDEDLRPYGPKYAMVCFDCATATPERRAETRANFMAQAEACGDATIVFGTEAGPFPVATKGSERC